MKQVLTFLVSSLLLFSCAPASNETPVGVVKVYATSAARPWLTELYGCAEKSATVLTVNAQEPDISLRLGESEDMISPAYQIDEEELLIVTNRESPVQNLSLEEAQSLFAAGNPSVQVWVYPSGEDVQMAFDQLVMKGRPVTSFAQVAVNEQEMSDLLNAGSNLVGILPRHSKTGTVRDVFSAGKVPVLAITRGEAQGVILDLLSCLQK